MCYIPTEITQGEIINHTNNHIANDDNDKYRNYTNIKFENLTSKEDTHTIQSQIINLLNINQRKYIDINEVLKKYNLQHVTNYWHNIGDCLFDSISYLLHYKESSTILKTNTMHHLKVCLHKNTSKAEDTRDKK